MASFRNEKRETTFIEEYKKLVPIFVSILILHINTWLLNFYQYEGLWDLIS